MSKHTTTRQDEGSSQDGFQARVLVLPRCLECGRFHFYPRPACPFCGSDRIAPTTASGKGSVYSYSVVYRAPKPEFTADVPYIVAVVATDEGPHMMTRIMGLAPDQVRIGMRVRVREQAEHPEPLFEPDEEMK